MANDLIALRDSVVNLLDKNNTTSSDYDISENLSVRVRSVRGGLPDYTLANTTVPLIFVRVGEYNEERQSMGVDAFKNADITFEIYPITQLGQGYNPSGRQKAEDENLLLTQNIQDLIRFKNNLSITGLMVNGLEASFNEEVEDNTYVKNSKIEVNCFKLVR